MATPDRPLLHLVLPRWHGTGIYRAFGHRMPPMALLVLGALARREGWRIRIIDENFDRIPDERPDLAALTVWTGLSSRAYAIADRYRSQGVRVVLGGVHASLLPAEALRHSDAVVCGEAEAVFPTVLADAAAGRLQPLYEGEWGGMEAVPTAHEWADIVKSWPITRYAPLNTIQTTRGCRFNCDFCSVIRINGRGSRHRDPDEVIEEIRVLKRVGQRLGDFTYVFFLDDDLAADLEYTQELCEAIVRAKVRFTWGAQASIGLARNGELLDLAVRSGCRVLFTGFESISREALIECNKKNRPGEFGELVDNLHRRGVALEGGFIFGFDHDERSVFQETVEFVDNIKVDVAHFSILTPYPGTQTYARMLADGRITSFDWSKYNLYNCVFEPARMSAEELEDGLMGAYRWFYAGKRRLRRYGREVLRRDPRFNGAMAAANWGYARNYVKPKMLTPDPMEAFPDDIAQLLEASRAPAQQAVPIAFENARRRLELTSTG